MDPNEALETGSEFMAWFTDYGALQILAMCGLLWPVVFIVLIVFAIRKLGKPIAKIADVLEKVEEA